MRISMWATFLALIFPAVVTAQDARSYKCVLGDNMRRVEIVSEPGVAVPCEVHYYKDSEAPGDKQVLWSAQSEAGYCEARTEEFIGKLTGWGWECEAGDPVMPSESAADEMLGDEPEEDAGE